MVTDADTNRAYHSLPRWLGRSSVLAFKRWLEGLYISKNDDKRVLAVRYLRVIHTEITASQMVSEFNRQTLPWQQRFGTKNTSFIEAILYHGLAFTPLHPILTFIRCQVYSERYCKTVGLNGPSAERH